MKIEINLPQIFDRSVCKLKGHDWSVWVFDPVRENATRICKRCGSDEKIDGVKPKHDGASR